MEISQNTISLKPGLKAFLDQVQSLIETKIRSNTEGKLQEMALYQAQNPGKKLRSQLIYHLANSLGAEDFSKIGLWAASNELMHEATLIHDDIQDQDHIRRGQDSLWKKFGLAQAINVGDFLLLLSLKPLTQIGHIKLIEEQINTSFKLALGQAEEISQKETTNLQDHFYINCIEKKTASLFSNLAIGVCEILNLSDLNKAEMSEVFLKLGCIFQMQDDILDLYGDKGRKSCGCDIKEGKISFLIHTHILHNPEDRQFLNNLLSKEYNETTQEEVENLKDIFLKKKTLEFCVETLKLEILALKSFLERTNTFKKYNLAIDSYIEIITKPIKHLL